LTLIADTSISGIRVSRELDRLLGECGKPKVIVSDNGTETHLDRLALHRPG
jgi:putative transposase